VTDDGWRDRMVGRFGAGVLTWADGVDARAAQLARRWGLELGAPFPTGNTSRTIAATRRTDQAAVVLKLVPQPELVAAEAAALRAWAAAAAPAPVPAVLELADDALLLERVDPGTRLVDRGRPASIAEVATLVRALHAPGVDPPPGLPTLRERLAFLYAMAARRGADPGLVARGRAAALELGDGADGPDKPDGAARVGLVHGDLHAGNVLDGGAQRGLVAIDPRPCIGDPLFDLVDWVLHDGDPVERAHALAAATGHDPQRLLAWTRATAVLAGPMVLGRSDAEERVGALLREPLA
jgi:streptomycin 6-kinase